MSRQVALAATLLVVTVAGSPAPAHGLWRAAGKAATYDQRTVYKAINGAAELYLSYGMKRLVVQPYSHKELQVDVQIYLLGSPLDALGVFRRERPRESFGIKAGDEAVAVAPHQCLARKGPHYLRVTAMRGRLDAASCAALLGGVTRALTGGAVPELALLPKSARVRGSLRFTRTSCFGLRELRGCLYGDYKARRGKPYQLFAVVGSSAAASDASWRRLSKRWKAAGQCGLTRTVPYRGTVLVVRTRRGLFGVAGLPDLKAAQAAARRFGPCP